jgi:hypothetical protein
MNIIQRQKNGISCTETRETTQQNKGYEIGYLEHYIAYWKIKGDCRRNNKVEE